MTNEGAKAIQELIDFLNAQKPLPVMDWQQGLMPASRDHVQDTGPTGIIGHNGSNGS